MQRRYLIGFVIVAVLSAIVLFVLFTGRSTDAAEWEATVKRQIEALERKSDADSLMTAAYLAWFVERIEVAKSKGAISPRALVYMRRAASLAPVDPIVQWASLNLCAQFPECDHATTLDAFLRVDPGNAAGWLVAADEARERGDAAAAGAAVDELSTSTHLNVYYNPFVVRVTDALDADGIPRRRFFRYWSTREHQVGAIGMAAAVLSPGTMATKQACEDRTEARRRAACENLLKLMSRSDTLLYQLLGTAYAQRWFSPESAEAAAAAARRRELHWLQDRVNEKQMRFVNLLTLWDWGVQLSLQRQYPDEVEVMQAYLRLRGVATEPPPGWSSSRR